MPDQEMNIAIAKACGRLRRVMTDEEWKLRYKKWCAEPDDPHAELTCPSTHEGTVPDYCHDLNAMHDAPHNLSLRQYADYGECLTRIVASDNSANSTGYGVFDATARQRAEAFLRVIGKWREAAARAAAWDAQRKHLQSMVKEAMKGL